MARFIMMAEFENLAQAQDMMAQAKARATNTKVKGMGSPGERTSYARLDDNGILIDMWHVDTFGIVRDGEHIAPPNTYPLWIQPTGGHDSYPATNAAGSVARVEYNGEEWENTHGDGNSWAPGVYGWVKV